MYLEFINDNRIDGQAYYLIHHGHVPERGIGSGEIEFPESHRSGLVAASVLSEVQLVSKAHAQTLKVTRIAEMNQRHLRSSQALGLST